MFDVTFLGHQGWLVESSTTRVLVDPLLGPGFGNMSDDVFDVFPPRRIDLAAFPAVDAVVASHEHPDHLSIPTLLRLDRRIRVLLPARASTAARALLGDLGFRFELLQSGDVVKVGDLEVHPFHSHELTRDEWDVAPLLIRERTGQGSFATSIDAPESAGFTRFVHERAGSPGVWATSHNHIDLFPVRFGGTQDDDWDVTMRLAREYLDRNKRHFSRGPRPEVMAIRDSGFCFKGDLAWMNRHAFPGRAERVAELVAPRLPGIAVRAPLPGHRFSFTSGKLREESLARDFFATVDPADWPPHGAERHVGTVPDYGPACGRRDFSADDLATLLEELRGFAAHLYGGEIFRALYAADHPASASSRAGVGFALRTSSGDLALAYRPEACAFEHVVGVDARAVFAAGIECWASDLYAVMRLELFSGYFLAGRYRQWNEVRDRMARELDLEIMVYTHPLRHPARTLALYRETVAELAATLGPARVAAGAAFDSHDDRK
jgi:hypothetical protein